MRAITKKYRRLAPSLISLAVVLAACSGDDGETGPPGPPGPPGDDDGDEVSDELDRGDELPGLELEILGVGGASGEEGGYQVGDSISVTYVARQGDGTPWTMEQLDAGRIHFAGPTFNYQRVIAEVSDLRERAVANGEGSYTYTFAEEIPASYLPPYNDTVDLTDGELTGQPLFAGTYTIGISVGWQFTVEGKPFVDVGEATRDVLFGSATDLLPREVTTMEHCNRCHGELQAHGGSRRQLIQCLMCHTAGAEDRNDSALLGGTPGVSVESRVLFHKIHNAAHLPSVLGIGVQGSGDQDYTVDPEPLLYVDEQNVVRDFSGVGHPVWPQRTIPRPRNLGWSALSDDAQRREEGMQTGLSACSVCHGDPDGEGGLGAPADGDLAFVQPARRVCGSCHDDVDFTQNYSTNFQVMPPQSDDSQCVFCHDTSGGPISVNGGHLHPLQDASFDAGLNLTLDEIEEAGTHDGDGRLDPGERVAITFTLTDRDGLDVDPAGLQAIEAVVSGPTSNAQFLLRTVLSPALLAGPQPFTVNLPQRLALEFVGDSSSVVGETFATELRPHLAVEGLETRVRIRTSTATVQALLEDASAGDNFLDLVDTSGIARGDVIVIEDGVVDGEEYREVQLVDGQRLWFGSPDEPQLASALGVDHAAGSAVAVVGLTLLVEGVDYQLNSATGRVTELVEFGTGNAVLVDYATDYRMPATTPAPPNDSPDVGEAEGEWRGKSLVEGTYAVTLSAHDIKLISFAGEFSTYPIRAEGVRREFIVGDAFAEKPYDLIADGGVCNACHQDLTFHEGIYRGFDSCLACHGSAGAEDLARYVAGNAPATPGVRVGLRELLHRVHRGADLDDPEGFLVVGEGPDPYPDNFESNTYTDVRFPAQPGGTLQCARCHGEENESWHEPAPREHPQGQEHPTRVWFAVCASCHDAPAAIAHMDSHTSPTGVESCVICHGPGETWEVERLHHPY